MNLERIGVPQRGTRKIRRARKFFGIVVFGGYGRRRGLCPGGARHSAPWVDVSDAGAAGSEGASGFTRPGVTLGVVAAFGPSCAFAGAGVAKNKAATMKRTAVKRNALSGLGCLGYFGDNRTGVGGGGARVSYGIAGN